MAFVRLTDEGDPDPDFGSAGVAAYPFGPTTPVRGQGLIVQPDGKYIGVGHTFDPDMVVMRVRRNGDLDPTFDDEGQVKTDVGSASQAHDVALTPNDRILAFGYANRGTNDFALVRYKSGL